MTDETTIDPVLAEALDDEAADGLDNPRLRFFFENQPLLVEWNLLAGEAFAQVTSTLRDLGDELGDGRAEAAGFMIADRLPGIEVQGPVLYRPAWCLGDDQPQIGFFLGWYRRVDPTGTWPGSTRPYYGVLTADTPAGKALKQVARPVIEARLKSGDLAMARFVKGTQFLTYRVIESPADWWKAVPEWRQRIADEMLQAAAAWAPVVDSVVAGVAGPTPPSE